MSNKSGDNFYNKLRQRQLELSSIPTQDLGVADPLYKAFSAHLKVAPWKLLIPLALIIGLTLAISNNHYLINLVTRLQEGF
ncbi:hypothetical protein HY025_05005 [Candidatus Daviesbacteria bacterium]|nr:hypothetical protein [Candidatus Daviesbacteria bacterium]